MDVGAGLAKLVCVSGGRRRAPAAVLRVAQAVDRDRRAVDILDKAAARAVLNRFGFTFRPSLSRAKVARPSYEPGLVADGGQRILDKP